MDQPPSSSPPPSGESLENEQPTGASGTGDSLETLAPESSVIAPTPSTGGSSSPPPARPPKQNPLKALWRRFNIYLLTFVLLLVVAVVVSLVLFLKNRTHAPKPKGTIASQNLSGEALQQLANTGGLQVGDPKQVLNIQSNAVFTGAVLVRGDLQVAGSIKTGGSLALTSLTVSGLGSFSKVQTQDLAVAGSGAFTGQLSSQGALSVGGGGSFGGPVSTPTLNANTLQLAGSLVLNNHIQAGGPRPSASGGGALGSGGTTSLTGSDTAGSITIHTGGSPGPGCFTTVRFSRGFGSPHVVVTPVGAAAGGLGYYVDRDGGSFSVCTTTGAPAGQTFGFDYHVFD